MAGGRVLNACSDRPQARVFWAFQTWERWSPRLLGVPGGAALEPTSIGHLRAGAPEPLILREFSACLAGEARFTLARAVTMVRYTKHGRCWRRCAGSVECAKRGGLNTCSNRLQQLVASPRLLGVCVQVGRKPASIGRLRAGRPETRVNTGLAGKAAGNAHFTRASEHAYRQCSFHPSFRPSTSSTPSSSPVLANPRIIARLPEQTRHPATARPGPHDKKCRAGFHCRISITIATSITPVLIAP